MLLLLSRSVHGIFPDKSTGVSQEKKKRVLEWGAMSFSNALYANI